MERGRGCLVWTSFKALAEISLPIWLLVALRVSHLEVCVVNPDLRLRKMCLCLMIVILEDSQGLERGPSYLLGRSLLLTLR